MKAVPKSVVPKKRLRTDELCDQFMANIRRGRWGGANKIPTEEQLTLEYGASRTTVRRAIKVLEDMGWVEVLQGSGRVAKTPPATTWNLGMVVKGPEIQSGNTRRIAEELGRYCQEKGWNLTSFALNVDPKPQGSLGLYLDISKLDGMVILGPAFPGTWIDEARQHTPIVAIGRNESAQGVSSFFMDYGAQCATAVSRLLQRGHRRILVTHGIKPFADQVSEHIEKAAAWTAQALGHGPGVIEIVPATLTRTAGFDLYHKIKQITPACDAIVSYGDEVLWGFRDEARRNADLRMADLPAILLNDHAGQFAPGEVEYFCCPFEEMTRNAVDELAAAIRGEASTPQAYPFQGTLIP